MMKGGFNLQNVSGSTLLMKVSNNSTEVFDRQVVDKYFTTNALERKLKIKDPKLMIVDP